MFTTAALAVALAASNTPQVPADPIPVIEGRWKGFYDDYEVEIKSGEVKLVKTDPKKHPYLEAGTVLARLSTSGGEADGSIYRFRGSSCLDHTALAPSDRKYSPCLVTASLTRYGNGYKLSVARFEFFRGE